MNTVPTPTKIGAQLREESRTRIFNRFDPFYLFLDRAVFAPFFSPRISAEHDHKSAIEISEQLFLIANIKKHRAIFWANALAVVAILTIGIEKIDQGHIPILVLSLSTVVLVSGIAWYNVSFSGVPERFGRHAMLVTGILFVSFSLSLTVQFVVIFLIFPYEFVTVILTPVYSSLYLAAIVYDNLDGLRATATRDKSVFSRAQSYHLNHQTEGQVIQNEEHIHNPEDSFSGRLNRSNVAAFGELTDSVDRLLERLSSRNEAMIANTLIANCLNDLLRIFSLTSNPLSYNQGLQELITRAHEMSVDEVNERAVFCLRQVLERLHSMLGDRAVDDIEYINSRLREIEHIRSGWGDHESNLEATSSDRQELADFLFVEVFRKLVSLIRIHEEEFVGASS